MLEQVHEPPSEGGGDEHRGETPDCCGTSAWEVLAPHPGVMQDQVKPESPEVASIPGCPHHGRRGLGGKRLTAHTWGFLRGRWLEGVQPL